MSVNSVLYIFYLPIVTNEQDLQNETENSDFINL